MKIFLKKRTVFFIFITVLFLGLVVNKIRSLPSREENQYIDAITYKIASQTNKMRIDSRLTDKDIVKKVSDFYPDNWDYLCIANYNRSGNTVFKQFLKARPDLNYSDFAIFDDYFPEHENGIVFIDIKKHQVLTVAMPDRIVLKPLPGFNRGVGLCINKEDAFFLAKANSEDNVIVITTGENKWIPSNMGK